MRLLFRRPLLLACGLFLLGTLPQTMLLGQFKFRDPPNRQDPAGLDARQGSLLWTAFREARSAGAFSITGVIVYRPNGAPSFRVPVVFSGDWSGPCSQSFITIGESPGMVVEKRIEKRGQGLILLEGEESRALEEEQLREPLFPGLPVTIHDLLMPYLDWPQVEYLGPDRFLGRPAHRFRLSSPRQEGFPSHAVVTLDEDYAALLEAELFDVSGFSATRIRVGGFRQFEDGWMFSSLVWEDRRERSSLRLDVYSFSSTP